MASESNRPPRQPPWEQGADSEVVSFGTWLRRERELRQVDLREIADETNISIRYLEALEEDRFDIVPGAVFTRGFLRQYADYVGLDGDEVVNSYLAARRETQARDDESVDVVPRRRSRWGSGLLLVLGLVAVLAAVGALALYVDRRESAEDEVAEPPPIAVPGPVAAPVPPAAEESPGPSSSVAEAAAPPLRAALDFQGECWVEAVADGRRVASELHVAGESLLLEAEESLRLTLGDPAVVRLEVNGEPYDLAAFGEGRVAEVDLRAPPAQADAPPPEPGPRQ